MDFSNVCLREWQQIGLRGYLARFEQKRTELSAVYQGCGKTIYSASCFVASSMNSLNVFSYKIGDIRKAFESIKVKKSFVVIFIPAKSIISTTIKSWGALGVNLVKLENNNMTKESAQKLLSKGVHGIIVTYHQVRNNHLELNKEWARNHLVKFIKRSEGIDITAVLDECHNLTIELHRNKSKTTNLNLIAQFFSCNSHLFKKIHLMSGTPVKGIGSKRILRIPFVTYTGNGEVVPDLLYDQDQAIADGVIVKSNIWTHSLADCKVIIDDQEISVSDNDLSWYGENYHHLSHKRTNRRTAVRGEQIESAFMAMCNSKGLWNQLIILGNSWLEDIRKIHLQSKGLIFTPSLESAIKVHKEILPNNSVLCVGKPKDSHIVEDCNFILSDKIHQYMESTGDKVDWIITCEALKEGFDLPDCKVSILLPRIHFLDCIKVSQMMGRTNRSIKENKQVQAVIITLKFKPVTDLIEANQSGYGICDPDQPYSEIIESWSQSLIDRKKDKILEFIGVKEETPEQVIFIQNLLLNIEAEMLGNKSLSHVYSQREKQKIMESNIRSYWVNWCDVVLGNSDAQTKNYPTEEPGIYYMINAKTQEYLYVGSSYNLLKRISDKNRFLKTEWIKEEGYQNIYVGWRVCENYVEAEISMKESISPKHDDENPPMLRIA